MIGRLVDAGDRAEELVKGYLQRIHTLQKRTTQNRPKVYFEEWDDPMISAIQWVGELIEIAGGENIFADRATGAASTERHVSSAEVIERNPDIYISCWCGKKMDKQAVLDRPEWDKITAIEKDQVHEMDPAIILQPGPACLTDGLDALVEIIDSA